MAYATVADVQARSTLRTFSASSRPNTTQVVEFIDTTAGELDGVLRRAGYQLPIDPTATTALDHLRRVNAVGARAQVEAESPTNKDGAEDRAMKEWLRLLAELDPFSKGVTIELDAPRDAHEANARSGTIGTAYFYRDQEF